MSHERRTFILNAFALRSAMGQEHEKAYLDAEADWAFVAVKTEAKLKRAVRVPAEEAERRVLEALAPAAVHADRGARIRDTICSRIRAKYGTAPGSAALQTAFNELRALGQIWMSLDRKRLEITTEGRKRLTGA